MEIKDREESLALGYDIIFVMVLMAIYDKDVKVVQTHLTSETSKSRLV